MSRSSKKNNLLTSSEPRRLQWRWSIILAVGVIIALVVVLLWWVSRTRLTKSFAQTDADATQLQLPSQAQDGIEKFNNRIEKTPQFLTDDVTQSLGRAPLYAITNINCFQKNNLWLNCTATRDRAACMSLYPDTYVFPRDRAIFERRADPKAVYIMKKSAIGERLGLKLARHGDVMRMLKIHGAASARKRHIDYYDVVQLFVQNLLLIRNRVFHVRHFLIVDCKHGAYLFRDSIYIYAKEHYNPDNPTWSSFITASLKTGAQNKEFYDKHGLPRDEPEFKSYCAQQRLPYDRIRKSLIQQYQQVVLDIQPCKRIRSYHRRQERRRTARVFGADAVILSDGSTRIIEVNNYPALRLTGIPEWQVHIKRRMLNHYKTQNYDARAFIELEKFNFQLGQ